MASYSLDEFLGAGVLKDMGSNFAEDGWDDVPTLKIIRADDMDALNLTDIQRDALELRIYLHNRSLMKYAERLEASGIGLIDLISMKPSELATKFRMRRNHVTTFVDTTMSCAIQLPPDLTRVSSGSRRRPSTASRCSDEGKELVSSKPVLKPPPFELHRSTLSESLVSSFVESYSKVSPVASSRPSNARKSNASDMGYESPTLLRPVDARKPNAPRGVFAAIPTARRMRGMVKAPTPDNIIKLSVLERVSVRQLAPDHKTGVDVRTMKGAKKPQPFKASNLWSEKATLFFCIRRPGCVMCRAEAHQLFARKPIFDALGVQLVAVLLEDIDEEVWAFWPRFWAGMVVLDEKRDFFRALGGGKLMKDNLFTGFCLNPLARLNWKRAMKTGIPGNARGEGLIKGGLFIVRRGKGGVSYQFAEKNFGDWAPLDEVLQVCHYMKNEGECGS
ncbi:uncharacterized protein [Physcomitrium patens]|uniref:Peroxiredoxin-like 2A n=1 Tax=Physcomitrium patens TaxID=3218 RepID=A0A2K1KML9_PHYPA|nr:uncharacterized protein LOC112280921 [Physcomitrium patens]PNR55023.1 hypothetical protein PHYPA_005916 [Physcomitrium patens]|eukprot:XP_024372646.1 uncharacterized protein LOC112280921 [Physcomitrella patens]